MTLRTIATPLTIGSFIAVCLTGLCLLFGYHGGLVVPVHEVSSIPFVVGSILHIFINRKATLDHLKQPVGAGLAIIFLILSVLAVMPSGKRQSDPRKVFHQTMEIILDSNIQGVAAMTRQSEQDLMQKLAQAGFKVIDPKATLRDIAQSNKKSPVEIMALILPEKDASSAPKRD